MQIKYDDAGFFPQEEAKCLANSLDSADTDMADLIDKVDMILKHFNQRV